MVGAESRSGKRGLLYKGFKIVPYCPRCGTPLSSHEVAQGYKDVKERSAIAKFKVKGEDAYILAWTTTPWTLPSNVALCVNPDETYVKVKCSGRHGLLSGRGAVLTRVLGEGYLRCPGDLYREKIWNTKSMSRCSICVAACEKRIEAFYVVCDTYVTLTDGTGVVHIAPAFGEDDCQGRQQI